jgi:2-polyprenyl-6-methoxyphenol hydroxylase-like FAD-dependent oxidoreductase
MHRADFYRVLEFAIQKIASYTVRLNTKVPWIEQDGDSVRAITVKGQITAGDVLISCDGIHSTIGETLFGAE